MIPLLRPFESRTPPWLRRLTPGQLAQGPLPWLGRLVKDAAVYPGSGTDGSPIRQLNQVLHSFILLDYGTEPEAFVAEATRPLATGMGFAHHRLVGLHRFDPTPILARAPEGARHPATHRWAVAPWACWGVWEDERPGSRGERFSVLFFGTEAHETLAALYPRGSKPPAAVVLVDHGFGGNVHPGHGEPLEALGRQWACPPELLIASRSAWHLPWGDRLQRLGLDRATESMHGDWRSLHLVGRRTDEPDPGHFQVPSSRPAPLPVGGPRA